MQESLFYTSETLLAIVFVYHGISVKSIDRSNPHRVEFGFERSEELDRLTQMFWNNEIRVEPRNFNAQTKLLKSQMFEGKKF